MKTLDKILNLLSKHKIELEKDYGVKELGVFGSFVRNEQKRSSDLDILVEFSRPIGLFKFIRLEGHLSRILGVKVDLVSKRALKPRIGKHILKELFTV